MKLYDFARKYFNKKELDSIMEEMETQSDYYKGNWGYCGLYMDSLCNYKVINKNSTYIDLIKFLKSCGCISASINRYSPGTVVYEHTDTDLTGDNGVLRCFIPLEYDYKYEFSGTSVVNDILIYNCKAPYTSDVLFVPQKNHSYKNLQDKEQYFLIVDICEDTSILTEVFWRHYYHFAIENYL